MLKEVLKRLASDLKPKGFVRRGSYFHVFGGNWATINLQKDVYSTADRERVVVNIGVVVSALQELRGRATGYGKAIGTWHTSIRLTDERGQGEWFPLWEGKPESDAALIRATIERAVPIAIEWSTSDGMKQSLLRRNDLAPLRIWDLQILIATLVERGETSRAREFMQALLRQRSAQNEGTVDSFCAQLKAKGIEVPGLLPE